MYLLVFNNYFLGLLITFITFVVSFFIWQRYQDVTFKKIMLVFLIMFLALLLIGISIIGYILFTVIRSN